MPQATAAGAMLPLLATVDIANWRSGSRSCHRSGPCLETTRRKLQTKPRKNAKKKRKSVITCTKIQIKTDSCRELSAHIPRTTYSLAKRHSIRSSSELLLSPAVSTALCRTSGNFCVMQVILLLAIELSERSAKCPEFQVDT